MEISRYTKNWLEQNGVSLKEKHILLTGSTGSLGKALAQMLLQLEATLILPVRNLEKGERLKASLLASFPRARLRLEKVDMEAFSSVDALAERLLAERLRLDCLVNNAGVFTKAGQRTQDGFELHQQVNALAPLRLSRKLLPLLRLSAAPKVVTVTSLSAFWPRGMGKANKAVNEKNATLAYGLSKRALMEFMELVAQREPGITFVYAHPGVAATELFSPKDNPTAYSARFLRLALPLMRGIFMSPDRAALSILEGVLRGKDGQLIRPRGFLHIWGAPEACALRKVD